MGWICGKSPQLIDGGRRARQSGLQPGASSRFRRRQMRSMGLSSEGMGRFGASSQGHQASFEELALPLFDSLYNFARWMAQNSNDAEDLVQETYLKALRSFGSFQQGTNFRAWIFRILRNTFLSSRSKLDRRMTVAIDSEDESPALPQNFATPESLLIQRSNNDA